MKSYHVGLTGSMGSGKSTVAEILQENGVPIYFADDSAKRLLVEDIELKKMIKSMGEKCKISIRNIRRDANEELKKLLKSKEIGEDEEKAYEKNVQTITDKHIEIVDEKVSSKEKEIMTI